MSEKIVDEKDLEAVSGGAYMQTEYYSRHEQILAVEKARKFKEEIGGSFADFTLYMRTPEVIRLFGDDDPGYANYMYLIIWAWDNAK